MWQRIKILFYLNLLFLLISCSGFSQNYNPVYKKGLIEAAEFSWDSTSYRWIGKTKYSFSYDINGSLSVETFKLWDGNKKKWIGTSQIFYTYNQEMQLAEKFNKFKSAKTGRIASTKKNKFIYKNNLLIEDQVFDISKKGNWIIKTTNKYGYDTMGKLITKITSKYINKSFYTCATEFYDFDKNGNCIQNIWENSCSGNNVLSGVTISEFDTLNRKISDTIRVDSGENTLKKYKFREDKIQKIQIQFWDKKDSLWIDNYLEFYLYNHYGSISEKIQQVRSSDHTKWENSKKTIYVYNGELQNIAEVELKWDSQQLIWFNVLKRGYKWKK